MNRFRLIASFALALALVVAAPAWANYLAARVISVTDATGATAQTFVDADTGTVFNAINVIVRSSSASANTCYFMLTRSDRTTLVTATTSHIPLPAGAAWAATWNFSTGDKATGWRALTARCAAGQTATFWVEAKR